MRAPGGRSVLGVPTYGSIRTRNAPLAGPLWILNRWEKKTMSETEREAWRDYGREIKGMPSEERKAFLAAREKEGRKIDPETAEVKWWYADCMNPLRSSPDLSSRRRIRVVLRAGILRLGVRGATSGSTPRICRLPRTRRCALVHRTRKNEMKIMGSVVFTGGSDVDAAAAALCEAGFDVVRMPEPFLERMDVPGDEFLEASKVGDLDAIWEEIKEIIKPFYGDCVECAEVSDHDVPFQFMYAVN